MTMDDVLGSPDVRAALDSVRSVVASAAAAVPSGDYAMVRARMATLLAVDDVRPPAATDPRLAELPAWPTSAAFTPADRTLLATTEQFVLDVAAVTDDQRAELADAFGPAAPTWRSVLYAVDVELRLAAVLPRVGVDRVDLGGGAVAPLGDALDQMTHAVGRLSALDPVTTELVRLRGARIHDCRICQSMRYADALAAGADEELFDAVDRYQTSGLDERHKSALRLTDAMLFTPGDVPAELVDRARGQLGAAETVEIVLDVARNARNKVAVAGGTDGVDAAAAFSVD